LQLLLSDLVYEITLKTGLDIKGMLNMKIIPYEFFIKSVL